MCISCGCRVVQGEIVVRHAGVRAYVCGQCEPFHRHPISFDTKPDDRRQVAPLVAGCPLCAEILEENAAAQWWPVPTLVADDLEPARV
jgi:hypothetical protein